jgi:hypothetical protein
VDKETERIFDGRGGIDLALTRRVGKAMREISSLQRILKSERARAVQAEQESAQDKDDEPGGLVAELLADARAMQTAPTGNGTTPERKDTPQAETEAAERKDSEPEDVYVEIDGERVKVDPDIAPFIAQLQKRMVEEQAKTADSKPTSEWPDAH